MRRSRPALFSWLRTRRSQVRVLQGAPISQREIGCPLQSPGFLSTRSASPFGFAPLVEPEIESCRARQLLQQFTGTVFVWRRLLCPSLCPPPRTGEQRRAHLLAIGNW